ncbi:hypothetical protein pEaSNUABM37_00018 [Erwinia phage pEa_SNUABM_37]|nr:hypothetical protein pEaSNUABM37_00018 [Erwinia phage pEa_SNUABM_37]QXO10488.1 hypothetical protein pEaSNUABM48_00018 [Erwinia phage pEa_SNUABM_48]
MAAVNLGDVVYPFNPLGTEAGAQIKGEDYTLTPANGKNYVTIVPRAAPFFRLNVKIINAATGAELVEDRDYTFGYMYNQFSQLLYKGLYGCITFTNLSAPINVKIDYATLGTPFVLSGAKYAELVANIVNNDREIFWEQIVNPPSEYPPIPHIHPASETMDYQQYIDAMKVGQNVVINAIAQYMKSLTDHGALKNAHQVDAAAVLLEKVKNYPMAAVADIPGNNDQVYVSLLMAKKIYQYMFTGLPQVALDSAVIGELLTAKATTTILTDLFNAGLMNTDEQANFKQWQTYVGSLIVKACKGTTDIITAPSRNGIFQRLLGQ